MAIWADTEGNRIKITYVNKNLFYRANNYYEELYEGNLERECVEESCSNEELTESLDAYSQATVL
jgi:hypothetical protein